MKIVNISELNSKIIYSNLGQKEINTFSNELEVENITHSFSKVKTSARTFAMPNEEVEQAITLKNNSEFKIFDIFIKDNLSEDAKFIDGSLRIDGIPKPGLNPLIGFALSKDIKQDEQVIIKYYIKINNSPIEEILSNRAEITYSVDKIKNITEFTNAATIELTSNKIAISKFADKIVATSGEKITYTVFVKNDGNLPNSDLSFIDPLPSSVTFIENSVKIDNVLKPGLNPIFGFALPKLLEKSEIKLSYEVMVNWYDKNNKYASLCLFNKQSKN